MTAALLTDKLKPIARSDLARVSAAEVRLAIRERRWTGTTTRLALGREQANLVILPERYAFDFMRFCLRNPKPLPLMEVTDPGNPEPKQTAPGADIRTDLAAYHVYHDGEFIEEVSDLRKLWRPDHVAFLTGCNLSLDQVMIEANIPLPHLIREDAWTSQYISNIPCVPAGIFAGPQVASMRPLPKKSLIKFIEISSRYPRNHGAPIHVGDPAAIGIDDMDSFKWGKRNVIGPDEVPVFCACGVTAHAIAIAARIPEMITHKPGHMFVTDLAILDPTASAGSVS